MAPKPKQQEPNEQDLKSLEYLTKKGYSPEDIVEIVKNMEKHRNPHVKSYSVGRNRFKFGVISDPHIGNIQYKRPLMHHAIKIFNKDDSIDAVMCPGDIFDGWYQNRPSSIFEQNAIGFDQQMKMAVEDFGKIKKPFYFITGNHSYNTFVRGAGVEAGPYLEDKLRQKGVEAYFLGNAEGDVELKNGTIIRQLHPDGGTAYAISYKSQKIIESLTGGEKPHILLIGHFHKAEYLFYRNVHAIQAGTLCGQTKFMKGKGIPAHTGFWVVDLHASKGGQVDKITPEFYPAYE